MQKNTPELWDSLWKETSEKEDCYNLAKEENSIRWQRIEKTILSQFKSFKNLKVIEVGAGGGTNALLFGKRGSKITILDYSKNAIQRSKEFFKRNNCPAEFILADALQIPEKLKGKYDVAMSFGLAEHFKGQERIDIIKSHLDIINLEGLALISVPNKHNIPYRLQKMVLELSGRWKVGEEYPFSRGEFRKIAVQLNIKNFDFFGDSFFRSFRFINPFLLLTRKYRKIENLRKEKGSFLDGYFSYALVFLARKN